MLKKLLLYAVLTLITINYANASEKKEVCVKYRSNYEWSKAYKVQATIIDGSELNRAVGGYKYASYDKFAVIFWDKGQASVLKLESRYLSYSERDSEDQEGKKWSIKESSGLCY